MGKTILLADLVLLSTSAVFHPLILLFSTMDLYNENKSKHVLFSLSSLSGQRAKEVVAEQTSFLSEAQER